MRYGPGAWYCYAHTEAQHYDEFGNPQPLTAIAQAAGTAVCFYSVVCAGPEEYYKSGSASESGWGTASVTATVYVEGIACHSNCNNYCENEGDCNCTS